MTGISAITRFIPAQVTPGTLRLRQIEATSGSNAGRDGQQHRSYQERYKSGGVHIAIPPCTLPASTLAAHIIGARLGSPASAQDAGLAYARANRLLSLESCRIDIGV
jgi:hypothetical protein